MYKEFEGIESPDNESTKIWRYMDFTKLVSLLDKKSLYFSNFKNFDDPFEGEFPYGNILRANKTLERSNKYNVKNSFSDDFIRKEKSKSQASKLFCSARNAIHNAGNYFINCWHENNYESAAMWKLYSDLNKGVAIQSTFKNFTDCFSGCEDDIAIGKVNYIDYEKDSMSPGIVYVYKPFTYKRISFEYEREIRAIIFIPHGERNIELNGIYVPISLKILIEKIYVSPTAEDWFFELVESITKKYDLKTEVIRSNLYEGPLY